MLKFSKGDLAVNESASIDQYAGLSKKNIQRNEDIFFGDTESKIEQPNIEIKPDTAQNAIPIQYNQDGSLKYIFWRY
jgi:hypothetical protein